MDEIPQAPPRDREDVELLDLCLDQATDGVALAYRVLDRAAERYGVDRLALVVRPEGLGSQVFFRGGALVDGTTAGGLLRHPAGLVGGDGEHVVNPLSAALTRVCELALGADLARRRSAEPGTLAPRPVIEQAMARAAACSGRFGWAHTAVVLTLATDQPGPVAWAALGAAVARAARVGDEVGWAAPGCALALLGNAGTDAVRPFLDRVEAALEGGGGPAGRVEVGIIGMPRETVDPEEAWRLVMERLADRVGTREGPSASWTGTLPSALELELRVLEGVVAVGSSGRGFPEAPQLTVVAADPDRELHDKVTRRVAEWFGPDAVPVVTVGAGWAPPPYPPPASNGHRSDGAAPPPPGERVAESPPVPSERPVEARVALVAARFDATTGTSEVVLGRAGARAVARAGGGPLAGGAQATLAALGQLGVDVPYYVRRVERIRDLDGGPVVVVLAPRQRAGLEGLPQDRMGVAAGGDEAVAAGRATLGALNRLLATAARPIAP